MSSSNKFYSILSNDTGALKKKVRHESRKDPYDQGTEAKDGSNVVVLCKTSFFEHVKNYFVQSLLQESQIKSIQNAVATKVNSESSGEAFVEFSVEIQFTANEHDYRVKLIAYTTSCKIMCQPIGVPSTTRIHTTSKSVSRYFIDTFFLPWCQVAYKKKIMTRLNDLI